MTIDPVCGMQVDEKTAKFQVENNGKTVHFCSNSCKEKFVKDPSKYPAKAK